MKKQQVPKIPRRIRVNFPAVTVVKDATKSIKVSVTKADSDTGRKKNPEQCALARSCMRQNIADGAIIGISYCWLIKGSTATRYKTSIGVSREITSFDRHAGFQPGIDYVLGKVSRSSRMGGKRGKERDPNRKRGCEPKIVKHRTVNIRKLK